MEAPKEIYMPEVAAYMQGVKHEMEDGNVKYIRADLAELDWKDIQTLSRIIDEEECDWNVKVWEKQEVAEQVLRRFNEQKNK
jgi:hypothetical protein